MRKKHLVNYIFPVTHFFISMAFFKLSVVLLFNDLSLKCCLSVFYINKYDLTKSCYILYICAHGYVKVYELYDLIFVIFFIFIAINQILSLKQPHLFIWTFLSDVQPQEVAYLFLFCHFLAWFCS